MPNSDSAGSARGLADRRVSEIHTERDTAVSVCTVQCICTVQWQSVLYCDGVNCTVMECTAQCIFVQYKMECNVQ